MRDRIPARMDTVADTGAMLQRRGVALQDVKNAFILRAAAVCPNGAASSRVCAYRGTHRLYPLTVALGLRRCSAVVLGDPDHRVIGVASPDYGTVAISDIALIEGFPDFRLAEGR